MVNKTIRIGTRNSELAVWQAKQVEEHITEQGHQAELVFITSKGDKDRTSPLYEMGGLGVFTKAVDAALINNEIDVAVHSFKDLPTTNPPSLTIAAVLRRADPRDVLVAPRGTDFLNNRSSEAVVATGSLRRKAQWLNRYPNHTVINLRGNVNKRIKKVHSSEWNGALFAAAGLLRINLDHHISRYIDWMIPAPAQAAVAVMVRRKDRKLNKIIASLNHRDTELCTAIEREFLHEMGVGCSAPVGAYAWIEENKLHFKATALTLDGRQRYDLNESVPLSEIKGLGKTAAQKMIDEGVIEAMKGL